MACMRRRIGQCLTAGWGRLRWFWALYGATSPGEVLLEMLQKRLPEGAVRRCPAARCALIPGRGGISFSLEIKRSVGEPPPYALCSHVRCPADCALTNVPLFVWDISIAFSISTVSFLFNRVRTRSSSMPFFSMRLR